MKKYLGEKHFHIRVWVKSVRAFHLFNGVHLLMMLMYLMNMKLKEKPTGEQLRKGGGRKENTEIGFIYIDVIDNKIISQGYCWMHC